MNDVYLTFNIPNFTDSVAERMSSCKRYFYDNGLLGNFLINAETKLLENIVAINLIERYGKEEDRVFFYHKGVEVDFYIPDEWLYKYHIALMIRSLGNGKSGLYVKCRKFLASKKPLSLLGMRKGLFQQMSWT